MSQGIGIQAAVLFAVSVWTLGALAYDPRRPEVVGNQTPKELEGIGIDERLGKNLNLDLPFVADTGEAVTLGRYFQGDKPVLLSIVYYNCPSLCNYHLNGVTEALRQINLTAGPDFQLVAVSMDAKEGPTLAQAKKANYLKVYDRPEAAKGWHFLTGSPENIARLASDIGFKFRWDEDTKQFAHASAAVILTPEGKISRYIHGIQPEPRNLRLALLEAAGGKVGSIVDKLVMFCFQFDPKKSKYTLYAWNIMRVGVIATVLILAILMIPLWWRERRSHGSA